MTVTPWWETLKLRDEIVASGGGIRDVQVSLYQAVYGDPSNVEYGDVGYYSDITHPTDGLVNLLAAVAVRLGSQAHSEAAKPVWRGDQAMGGGKSHGLVGLWHMASNPTEFAATELGKQVRARARDMVGEDLPTDLNEPVTVVLSCDEMVPGKPDKDIDGPAETLGERWLWRLSGEDMAFYKRYRDRMQVKHGVGEAIEAAGRPVLTLVDEILDYVRNATAGDDQKLATNDMAFLTALMEATTKADNAALVIVAISSEHDVVTMTDFGERARNELEEKFHKYATTTATTSGGDFAEIIRRRLFVSPPPGEVTAATADLFWAQMGGAWPQVFEKFSWATRPEFASAVARSYPFHPAVVDLIEREWAPRHAGFQKVRSTIQIFAAAVWAQQRRAKDGQWAPLLIGVGDLPLSDAAVRENLLNSGIVEDQRTISSYREIAASDVVDGADVRGAARTADREREDDLLSAENPRVAERVATALFVYSLAPRAHGVLGATDYELKAAGFVPDPDCDLPSVEAVLTQLESSEATGLATLDVRAGKGGQPRRLLLSTRQTLAMFFRGQRNAVTSDEINDELRKATERLATSGPFHLKFVSAADHSLDGLRDESLTRKLLEVLEAAQIDDGGKNRLLVLDPSAFTLLNGVDAETRKALGAALGLNPPEAVNEWWPQPMSVVYASSCVFSVVNTQRRKTAVQAATDVIAWNRVLDIDVVRSDETLKAEAEDERRGKRHATDKHLKAAFQHVVYLGEAVDSEGNRSRQAATIRFDKDNQTALDGAVVWAALAEADKAFEKGDFDAQALLFNLRDNDWGKPLAEIRNAFYSAPRLPLLPDGDRDLRTAIYQAYQQGSLRIVGSDGNERVPTKADDINVTATGIHLSKPVSDEAIEAPSLLGLTYPAAKQTCAEAGVGLVPEGEGHIAGQTPEPGEPVLAGESIDVTYSVDPADTDTGGGGSSGTPPEPGTPSAEQELAFSFMGLTFEDETQREAAYELFGHLAGLIDSENASHLQATLRITGTTDQIDILAEAVERLGGTANRRDV